MSIKGRAALLFLVILAMGVGILYLGFFAPLAAARARETVTLHEKALFIGPLLIVGALVGLCISPFANERRPRAAAPPTQRQQVIGTLIGIVVVVVFGAIGFALRARLLDQLAGLGYRF